MSQVTPLLHVLLVLLLCAHAHCQHATWEKLPLADVRGENPDWKGFAFTTGACLLKCLTRAGCLTAAFNRDSLACLLYHRTLVWSPGTQTPEPGLGYYWKPVTVPCPASYTWSGGVCLKVTTTRVRLAVATSTCAAQEARLMAVKSHQEMAALRSVLQAAGALSKPVWLGGSDEGSEGRWRWPDGQEVKASLWAVGMPDNWTGDDPRGENAMTYEDALGGLDDVSDVAGNTFGFVCQVPHASP